VDGVKIGRFYAADGDDNFIVTDAYANDCCLCHIDYGIGDQWNLVELTYTLCVVTVAIVLEAIMVRV
jgi:hypothetical protein